LGWAVNEKLLRLAALENATGPVDYLTRLRRLSDLKLTDDFWTITLPEAPATSGSKTSSSAAYLAAPVALVWRHRSWLKAHNW